MNSSRKEFSRIGLQLLSKLPFEKSSPLYSSLVDTNNFAMPAKWGVETKTEEDKRVAAVHF